MTALPLRIGAHDVGDGHPVFVISEIGLNHNGDIAIAKRLIDAAVDAGCQLVKFQKRSPEHCVPRDQWHIMRDTPWGKMSYIDYRHRIEFNRDDYDEIDAYCADRHIAWSASAWDTQSVRFLDHFQVPCFKIPSACLTNHALIEACVQHRRPVILSTGMSTQGEIIDAVKVLGRHPSILMHCTSTYPCKPEELNLRCITRLIQEYPEIHIGYSGHETGIPPTLAAVALGARVVERHITLDRTMWGTDQAASLEPVALATLVRQIRTVERSLGDGVKKVYESELPIKEKLRKL